MTEPVVSNSQRIYLSSKVIRPAGLECLKKKTFENTITFCSCQGCIAARVFRLRDDLIQWILNNSRCADTLELRDQIPCYVFIDYHIDRSPAGIRELRYCGRMHGGKKA